MSRLRVHPENHNVDRIGWLRAAVLGANDGIVSTASLIVGVAAASAKPGDILLTGVAGLVAGAMSMAAGEYVSVSSQSDTEHADLSRERKELGENVEFEREELAQIYVKRGVDHELAVKVADQLMAKDALGAHARDELGISEISHGTARASCPYLGGHVRGGCCDALADGSHRPNRQTRTHRLCRLAGLPRSFGCSRSQGRRCRRREGNGTRHVLGRARHGGHGRHRQAFRGCRVVEAFSGVSISRATNHTGYRMADLISDRLLRRALLGIALTGLILGTLCWLSGYGTWAGRLSGPQEPSQSSSALPCRWHAISWPGAWESMLSRSSPMSAALLLGEPLAGAVVAVMYAGGNLLEDFAVARAERDLKSLVDRAPRVAHRRIDTSIEDVTIDQVAVGDTILVRAGEVIPVDGLILGANATLDEAALTGEPIPVTRNKGDPVHSGTINAGETFELRASASAGESTYAGIVRMVTAAQTAKAPFIRLADRYALILLPVTLVLAGAAWLFSGDPIRGLAVLVASTPCPLILAAPVAFIAGVSRAARLGILIKGGGPLEALARTHTVMFDKTGTLTVGRAWLVAVETAPGESADDVYPVVKGIADNRGEGKIVKC